MNFIGIKSLGEVERPGKEIRTYGRHLLRGLGDSLSERYLVGTYSLSMESFPLRNLDSYMIGKLENCELFGGLLPKAEDLRVLVNLNRWENGNSEERIYGAKLVNPVFQTLRDIDRLMKTGCSSNLKVNGRNNLFLKLSLDQEIDFWEPKKEEIMTGKYGEFVE